MKRKLTFLAIVLGGSFLLQAGSSSRSVDLQKKEGEHKVEVHVGGKFFTAYQYGPDFDQKPVFYPVLSPGGVRVNREYPMQKGMAGESQDHPHHQSVFFGYGDVEGADYWSSGKGEKIVHQAFLRSPADSDSSLSVLASWVNGKGEIEVQEIKRVSFGGTQDSNWMDHDLTITALDRVLDFNDTKEGIFAFRVSDSLREDEGSGRYINAFGIETSEKVWGKRAPWVALRGEIEGNPVTIAMFDHPSTVNYPSYWHARAYGLFAVNPFGRVDFVEGADPLGYQLRPHESFHFRYRVNVYDGKVSQERLNQDYWDYIQ